MRKRKLGRTGYMVAELGMGTAGFDGDGWRAVDPGDAQRTLYAAIEAGVTFVDTSPSHGDRIAEKLVGEVIRDLRARDRVVVASKVPPMDGTWPGSGDTAIERVFHPSHVQASVEQSLRDLCAEAIPLAQLDGWHDGWLSTRAWADVRGRMQLMIKQGKVLHWGVCASPDDPDAALDVLGEPIIETAQVCYNVFERRCEANFLARADRQEVAVIARAPLDRGALSGYLSREHRFLANDPYGQYFADSGLAETVTRVEALAGLCGDEATSVPELALRFALSRPEVAAVLTGMRRPAHVHANIAAIARGPLSASMLARLADHAWTRNLDPRKGSSQGESPR